MTFMINIVGRIKKLLYFLSNNRRFQSLPRSACIISPLRIDGKKNISIGQYVIIQYKTWLAALPLTGESAKLEIGDGTIIGNYNHIYATKHIKIGKNVLTADKVYIADNMHGYEDINTPIMHQEIRQINTVNIDDGVWLGENVCIMGASIGRNSVIGANSVVTRDVPAYSVAVGIPAKVIKTYCHETKSWVKIQ